MDIKYDAKFNPAFPRVENELVCYGISARDYFAAKAMQGQMAFSPHDSFDKTNLPDEVAALAYRFADAMLAERAK